LTFSIAASSIWRSDLIHGRAVFVPNVAQGLIRRSVAQESFGDEHPALTTENFAGLPHLEISSIRHATDFADKALAARGRTENSVARAIPFRCAHCGRAGASWSFEDPRVAFFFTVH
jgi:hypothetical protein